MSTLSAMTITNHMMTEIFSDPYLGITKESIYILLLGAMRDE